MDAQRILRDVKLMKHLVHENVLALLDVELLAADGAEDVYVVTELMESDLHRVIHSSQELSVPQVRIVVYAVR